MRDLPLPVYLDIINTLDFKVLLPLCGMVLILWIGVRMYKGD
jgi:hypothetical protein